MKKIITFLTLLFSLVSFAQYTLTLSDIDYVLDGTNLTITGYTNTTEKDIIIPASFIDGMNTYTVKTIGDYAFYEKYLTSLTLPNSLINIGLGSFISNSLTNLTIPNSVTTIGNNAFSSNSLIVLNIPSSVTTIGSYAFYQNSLSSVSIPKQCD